MRTLLTILLLYLAAFSSAAAPVAPEVSNGSEAHWYYMKYAAGTPSYVVESSVKDADGDPQVRNGEGNRYSALWKVVTVTENGQTFYRFVSYSGRYFTFKMNAPSNSQDKFYTMASVHDTYLSLYELQSRTDDAYNIKFRGQNYFIDNRGGGNQALTVWNTAGNNTKMTFIDPMKALEQTASYYTFAAGNKTVALYEQPGSARLTTAVREVGTVDNNMKWKAVPTNDNGGYRLQNAAGRYVAWSEAAGFTVVTDAAAAYTFTLKIKEKTEGEDQIAYTLATTDGTRRLTLSAETEHALAWTADGTPEVNLLIKESLPLLPKISNATESHWTYIKFNTNSAHLSDRGFRSDNGKIVNYTGTVNWTVNLWRILFSPRSTAERPRYLLQCYTGNYISYRGDANADSREEFYADPDPAKATDFELFETNGVYQLKLADGSKYIDCNSGTAGRPITTYSEGNNTKFTFVSATDQTGDLTRLQYYAFSSLGAYVITDDGEGAAVTATLKATAAAEDNIARWQAENGDNRGTYLLKNGSARYIAYDEDAGFTTTADRSAAYPFTLDNNNYDRSWAFHYSLRSTDGTQYLTLPDAKAGTLVWSAERSRFNVLQVGATTGGVTAPDLADATAGKPMYIRFNSGAQVMVDQTYLDGSGSIVKENKNTANPIHLQRQSWLLEAIDGGRGDFRFKTAMTGRYLRLDQTVNKWVMTSDSTLASPMRLVKDNHGSGEGFWEILAADAPYHAIIRDNLTVSESFSSSFLAVFEGLGTSAGTSYEDYSAYSVEHKRSYFVKRAADAVKAGNADEMPGKGFILADGDLNYGWVTNPYTGARTQATSTYQITRYIKPGSTHNFRLPNSSDHNPNSYEVMYQRFYDYETDLPVDSRYVYFSNGGIRLYANGHVMGDRLPFNGSQGGIVKGVFSFYLPCDAADDFEYRVALDTSLYTDFVDYFGENGHAAYDGTVNSAIEPQTDANLIEPTLTGRYIYTVRNGREVAERLARCTYTGDNSGEWLEEHVIHFPDKFVSFKPCTVPFNNELQNYWMFTDEAHTTAAMTNITAYKDIVFSIDAAGTGSNPASIGGFGVDEWPIDNANTQTAAIGSKRFLQFRYPGHPNVGTVTGDSCVIRVYARANGTAGQDAATSIANGAKLYQLCKYTIHFDKETEPLPLDDVIGEDANGTPLNHRSPEALYKLTGQPAVAEVTFDTDGKTFAAYKTPVKGTSYYYKMRTANAGTTFPLSYAYPLAYDNSSYSFFPCGDSGSSATGSADIPENVPGSYTITRRFKVNWGSNNNFHPISYYYKKRYEGTPIADRFTPETDAFLYIDCSELPGKIANLDFSGDLCAGSRLFFSGWMASAQDFTGSTGNDPGNIILEVIGHTADGRDVPVYRFSPGPVYSRARRADGTVVVPARGEDNIWQHIYFTFVNNSEEPIVSYSVSIDNACTSTAGGDFMLDDIEIYALKPSVEIEHTSPVCGAELTLTKMATDFDAVMHALGLTENVIPAGGNPRLWYCMLDKEVFDADTTGVKNITPEALAAAFNHALVGNPRSDKPEEAAFRNIELTTFYDRLTEFNYRNALAANGTKGIVMKQEAEGLRHLIISDKINATQLKPKHEYYMLYVPQYGNDPIRPELAPDQFQIGSRCCVKSTFMTAPAVQIVKDEMGDAGDGADNEVEVCAGQNVNLTVQMDGVDGDTGESRPLMIYYDWWIDYVGGDFAKMYLTPEGKVKETETPDEKDITLRDALQTFRHFYPEATVVSGLAPKRDAVFNLTQPILDGLLDLTQPHPAGTDEEGNLTPARPEPLFLHHIALNLDIPSDAHLEDAPRTVTVIPIEFGEEDVIYCFEPQFIRLKITGQSPSLFTGFHTERYPEGFGNADLRATTAMIEGVKAAAPDALAVRPLRVPLRTVKTVMEGSTLDLSNDGLDYTPLYIVGTNDPACEVFEDKDDAPSFRIIGRVTEAVAVAGGADNHVTLSLNKDFTPREGYSYTLRVNFTETVPAGNTTTPCPGAIVFDLKVVPAYVKWTAGDSTTDWANDHNWARADRDELHFDASYTTNEANGTAGAFVPLTVCRALIAPAPMSPLFYAPSYDGRLLTPSAGAGANIQYDLVMNHEADTEANRYDCLPFYTNRIKDFVLQAGGEAVRAELLEYEKAWTEYALTPDRWFTLASPMQEQFAGDWYSPTAAGRQETPYFAPIEFVPETYDRFSPAVYQRGWDKGEAKLVRLTDYPALTASATDNVAVRADWSTVYNDVAENYGQGGFSVKPSAAGTKGTYSDFLFRLPKEDTDYNYYLGTDNTVGGDNTAINRTAASHRLRSDAFKTTGGTITQTLTNKVAANLYHLAANPFGCGLDMRAFFEANAGVIEPKYWLLTATGQTAVMKDETGWITLGADSPADAAVLASGQGFFVKALSPAEPGTLRLTFTAEMQTSATAARAALRSPLREHGDSRPALLRLTARRNGERSEAVVIKDKNARNAYDEKEDMESFFDQTLAAVPTVYTIAGNRAAGINRRATLDRLPLGIMSNSEDETTLTFSGLNNLDETLSLLDNMTGEVIPLTLAADGQGETEVTLPGLTLGRYFLLSSDNAPTDIADEAGRPLVLVNGHRVEVSASLSSPLTAVNVVDAQGRTLYTLRPFTSHVTIPLPLGLYVIEARTAEAETTVKVTVN